MKAIRLAFLLPALIATAPAHAETRAEAGASAERPAAKTQHHRLEHIVREFARRAEEQRMRESMLARR